MVDTIYTKSFAHVCVSCISTMANHNPRNQSKGITQETQNSEQKNNNSSSSKANETFTLLLFASARAYCSETESLTLAAPMTLRALLAELERRWPGVGDKILRRGCQIVRNLDYLDVEVGDVMDGKTEGEGEVVIGPGDEVAVVPPVSAG